MGRVKFSEINWAVFQMPVILKAVSNGKVDEVGRAGEMSPLGVRQRLPQRERDVCIYLYIFSNF